MRANLLLVVVGAFVALTAGMAPSPVTSPSLFDPLRGALESTDIALRAMEDTDRQEVDAEVSLLAQQVLQLQSNYEGMLNSYDKVKNEMRYLQGKATMSDALIGAYEKAMDETNVEKTVLENECSTCDSALSDVIQAESDRINMLSELIRVLDDHVRETQLEEQTRYPSEQALAVLDLVQQDASDRSAVAPHAQTEVPKSLEGVVTMLQGLRSAMSNSPAHAQRAALSQMCTAVSSKISLQTARVKNNIWNATQTQKNWQFKGDEKERQITATNPVLDAKSRAIAATRKEIGDLANAYQGRRNARLTMLCYTVTSRRQFAADSNDVSILDAVLPGPAQYEQATTPAQLACPPDLGPIELPGVAGIRVVKPCRRHIDGDITGTLEEIWADRVSDEPCLPIEPRVIDVNPSP
eukprot:c25761_g1_i1.p1 GENE.c25761_g1_i1~~c25761_g1_i1.p1  ORF type:complete len:417 (+),score=118.38 c25761_g1_i1:24-1253(+)